ncbi:MAG TPA: RNA polymerase sigma factor [Candidatus Caccoplasma intestinavium]|uniref:RNA polymerase sigma factor n=1 Tax=Candidatus Caccoplasma intestinavium TaxID=2840716 RepID=A0A9D1KDK9_9BACT|nr:sigma-70 region 2 [Bacteroides sp. CAG:144]HIT39311.1 RNA polymerase sigma factor [Candidatus Caccoplasma intestinavium]
MTKKEMADYLVANQKPLWQSAFYLTKNEDDASDLTQSVFLKALCNFEKFTDSTNLGGWLYTIMRNLFINQCRSADQVRISRSDKEYETAPNDLMYGTTESADSRCTMQDIEHAIDILNKEYSIPFRMYVSGYKYQEIADKMNIPLGTVKSRIFIARKKAQAYLTEKPTAKSTTHKLVIKNAQSTLFSNGNRMDQKF